MGHGSQDGHVVTMNVQRHPTIPMTKRDSLVSNGNRVTLQPSGQSHYAPDQFEEKDFVNTNPDMVSGKKRTAKKVKRTDSYKRALNRQSGNDELEEWKSAQNGYGSVAVRTGGTSEPRKGDRTKYNTLPRTEPIVNTKHDTARRKRPESDGIFQREASQRSGTYYPSPDTDDDQRSVQPERKKKSAFKRVKERLSLAFKKDRDHEKNKGRKKGDKYKSPSRVKPHSRHTHDAFGTPHDDKYIVGNCTEITQEPQGQNGSFMHGSTQNRTKGDDSSSETNRGQGFLRTIRNSFRRKNSTNKTKGKYSTDTAPGTSSSSHSPASHDNQPAVQHRGLPGQNRSQPIKIPRVRKIFEEQFIDADDDITALFGTLIDPEGTSRDPASPVPDFHAAAARSRPDRSKLKLEGLKKFKPRSFDRESPKQRSKGFRLSPFGRKRSLEEDLEIDGVDAADGLVEDESELNFGAVSQQEKQRRVDEVAQRLRAIGDSVFNRRESDSAGSSSEHESHTHRRRLSQLEEELLRDLRQYGDNIDGDMRGRVRSALSNISVSETIIPSVMQILRAQDYSSFQTVVKREIENTVGWEMVAWYTYLIKTSMDVAKVGQFLGRKVKNHATRYFSSDIRPWIQSRPQGWESIHEETDIDTELD